MYNILIAEDSKLILRDIERLIYRSGYEVTFREAFDGETALDILKEFQPDLIFTDIKMPVISGLELIQYAKKLYPQVKCVIISGYADFTFTHEALVLQVDDYVMKPVDMDQFHNILSRLVKEIDEIRIQREELMLSKVLQEEIEISNFIFPKGYLLTVVRAGLIQQYAAPLPRELLCENMEESDAGRFWVIGTKLYNEKVIIYDLENETYRDILEKNKYLLENLKKNYTRVNIICSEKLTDISQLYAQYLGLSGQLRKRILLDDCRVYEDVAESDMWETYVRQKEEVDIFKKRIELILRNRSAEGYKKEIKKRVVQWKENHYTVVLLRKYLTVLLEELFIAMEGNCPSMEEPGILADKILNENSQYDDLAENLLGYAEWLAEEKEEKIGVPIEFVQKLTDYMNSNVYRNLSLQDISDFFKISPSYICRMFKIYYGDSPISFYNKIKIEEAKRLLMEYRNMKVKDIAELLGFSDQYYFSKVFKQQYGVSPSVYKIQIEDDIT